MRTTAVPSADGTHYVLNGQKIWISNAGYAGVFTVFAKVPVEIDGKPKQRVTAFIVDAHAPGVSLGKIEEKMGIKASDTRAVTFENVKVPAEDRLGDVGHGFKIALEILNSGRLGLAAGSAAGHARIIDIALAYAKQREQFGRPIGSFEMIQRKFAVAAAECYAADAAWMVTASMVDRGGIDFSLETAACKVFASELAFRAASDAHADRRRHRLLEGVPVRAGRARLAHQPDLRGHQRDPARAHRADGLQQPGEHLKAIGKAFNDPLHSLGAIGSYLGGRVKRQLVKPEFTRVHAALKDEAELIATVIHDLALGVEKLLIAHGKDVIEHQFQQERMANAAIDIYLATATLSRATWAIAKRGRRRRRRRPTSTARASSSRWRCAARAAPCARSSGTRTRG